MSDPMYASKKDLLAWLSNLLSLEISDLNELISGAVWCQVLDVFFAGVVMMSKVDFFAYKYEQCILNYKVLQVAFDKLQIRRDVDVKKLLDGHQGSLLELLQWLYKFCYGRDTQPGYNPVERRRISKHGGTSRIPTFGISNGAFKKWRLKEEKTDSLGGVYLEPVTSIRRDDGGRSQPLNKSRAYDGDLRPASSNASTMRRTSGTRGSSRLDSAGMGEYGGYGNGRAARHTGDHHSGGLTNGAGVSEGLRGASDVAAEATAGLTKHIVTFQRLTQAMSEGALCTYIARGKMRSLEDVLTTLNRHTALLLKDISLRLDISHSVQDVQLRVQVDHLSKELAAAQHTLEFVIGVLRDYELRAPPPREGIESSSDTVDSEVIHTLDHLLRKVGSAQAALPEIRDPNYNHAGLLVQLQDVDPATKLELKGQQPQFFDTTTSVAFKMGNFQVRKLRNGDVYKGRYFQSKKAGDGHYAFLNGDVYEGEFVDDHMEGYGVYTFSSQGRYEGQWHAALYSGLGTETFAKGSTYHGSYHKGNRCGFGVCRYYNGDHYAGEWLDGLRSGCGMQQCTDDSNYVGEYKNGKRHGYGVYTFPNGDSFMGQYEFDMPHGVGVYMFGGGQSYEGRWMNGKKHGLCEYVVESGEKYAGEWENGKPKWVQSLDSGKSDLVSSELEEKMANAGKAAAEAREAADVAREKAVQYWRADGEMQTNIRRVLAESEEAAAQAQVARARAMALAYKLDECRRKEAGPTGWPSAAEGLPQ